MSHTIYLGRCKGKSVGENLRNSTRRGAVRCRRRISFPRLRCVTDADLFRPDRNARASVRPLTGFRCVIRGFKIINVTSVKLIFPRLSRERSDMSAECSAASSWRMEKVGAAESLGQLDQQGTMEEFPQKATGPQEFYNFLFFVIFLRKIASIHSG